MNIVPYRSSGQLRPSVVSSTRSRASWPPGVFGTFQVRNSCAICLWSMIHGGGVTGGGLPQELGGSPARANVLPSQAGVRATSPLKRGALVGDL